MLLHGDQPRKTAQRSVNGEGAPTTRYSTPTAVDTTGTPKQCHQKLTAGVPSHPTLAGQPIVAEDRVCGSTLCAAQVVENKERAIQSCVDLEYRIPFGRNIKL